MKNEDFRSWLLINAKNYLKNKDSKKGIQRLGRKSKKVKEISKNT